MHDDERPERLGPGPEGVVLREREILAIHVPADRGSAKAEPFDPVLELIGCQIGMLQRHRRQRNKAIGVFRHPRSQSFVLRLNDLACKIAVCRVPPKAIDGQRLNIDALLIHHL